MAYFSWNVGLLGTCLKENWTTYVSQDGFQDDSIRLWRDINKSGVQCQVRYYDADIMDHDSLQLGILEYDIYNQEKECRACC